VAKLSAPNAGAKNAKKSVKIKKVQDQQVEAHLIVADARHDTADANASGASTPQLSMGTSFSFAAATAGADGAAGASPHSSGGDSFPILPVLGGLAVAGGVAAALAGGGEKNVAPTLAAVADVAGKEDTPSTITLSGADANKSDVLTYSAGTPANGTVSVSGNVVTYTPKANFNGTDSFTVTVTDKAGLTATQTVKVNVAAVNDAPTFAAATQAVSVAEDATATVTLAATDVDTGDKLTYTASAASKGTVTISGATLTYKPNADYNGTDSVVVTVSDGNGGTATQTINFTVTPVVAEAGSLDVGTANAPVTLDASKDLGGNSPADWAYSDDSSKESNVIINNFAKGDTINVTGKSTDYAFTSVGTDLVITYNNTTASVVK